MSSKETWILVSGIAATLQLCRLSFDLISTASQKDAKVSERLETATREELRESIKSSSRISFLIRNRTSKRINETPSLQTQKQPPQASSSESASPVLAPGKDEESMLMDGDESGKSLTRNEMMVVYASLIGNASLLIYFFATCLLQGLQKKSDSLYSTTALGCLTVSFFLSTVMCIRDWKRDRFSNLQRVLYSLSALLLALGIIFRVALWKKNDDGSESLGAFDIVTLVVLLVYAAFVLVECKVIPPMHVLMRDPNAKKARLSYRKVFRVLKPYFWPDATASSATLNRIRALSTWACVAIAKACSLTAPIFLGKASTQLAMFQWRECIRNVIWYCLLNLGNTIFREAQSLVYLRVAQAAFVQLSELSFSHLHSLSLDWHLRKKLGEVIRSMDRGILACDTLVKYLFLWLVPALAECILVAVIFATYFDYLPLAVNIFYFVFAYMVLTILLTLWRKKFRKQVAKSDNDWHDIATDSLMNFETVKYFTSEEYEMKKFGAAVETYQQGSVNVTASLSMLNISQAVLLQACLAVSLTLATFAIQDRFECCAAQGCSTSDVECCTNLSDVCPGMEIGDFVAVLSYTINLFVPLNFLGSIYNAIVMAMVDLTNLSELLAENPDVRDAKDAVDLPDSNSNDPDIAVEFDNVHFHYPTQPESSGLKGVSFKMKKGTTTAIVGSTGAGKTTISRLLFRFYDVTGGAVKVNGVDVRTVKQKDLRERIGVVPQTTTLFNDTLSANIKYGKQNATEFELEEAAKAAQLMNFIESLPEKWNTMVGDRGLKLSGGEKQRTAIARCILKNPPICIFDEATSALDTITEASVKEALDRLGNDRTVLVIAHRLGTIKNADNIIVLNDGKVAEEGKHEELLAKGGQYADMWNMQLNSTKTSETSLGLKQDLRHLDKPLEIRPK